ncbi:MAG: hypothetical protein WHF31_00445 [Candidatus Dehalobacter alkaniphilus]
MKIKMISLGMFIVCLALIFSLVGCSKNTPDQVSKDAESYNVTTQLLSHDKPVKLDENVTLHSEEYNAYIAAITFLNEFLTVDYQDIAKKNSPNASGLMEENFKRSVLNSFKEYKTKTIENKDYIQVGTIILNNHALNKVEPATTKFEFTIVTYTNNQYGSNIIGKFLDTVNMVSLDGQWLVTNEEKSDLMYQ